MLMSTSNSYRNTFSGNGISQTGSGTIRVDGDVTFNPDNNKLLSDLYVTNPSHDKTRIEQTKGGLSHDISEWILEHVSFRQWRDNPESSLLWIRGDPGKGKTMLICTVLDDLRLRSEDSHPITAFFFCQTTDDRLNNTTAVLRGLVWMLVTQKPDLAKWIRREYENSGEALFNDPNAFFAMRQMLESIINDSDVVHRGITLVVDALDECSDGLGNLFILIEETASKSHVKWIVSSRNTPAMNYLATSPAAVPYTLTLDLNAEDSVSQAVRLFVQRKTGQLAHAKGHGSALRTRVAEYLESNAQGTFLWVALVCNHLLKPEVTRNRFIHVLQSFPPGLDSLYERMLATLDESSDKALCKRILGLAFIAKRPLGLEELQYLAQNDDESVDDIGSNQDFDLNVSEETGNFQEVISHCGSFLTIRDGIVYFIHQSAKDFFSQSSTALEIILPSGVKDGHRVLYLKCIQQLQEILHRDIYRLDHYGPLEQFDYEWWKPEPDPLKASQYSCVFWIDHLLDGITAEDPSSQENEFQQSETVYSFLTTKFPNWLEALALLKQFDYGLRSILRLQRQLRIYNASPSLGDLVYDADRFMRTNREGIIISPLQVYVSALLFSPTRSLIRKLYYEEYRLPWLSMTLEPELDWDDCIIVLGTDRDAPPQTATFSPDSQQFASTLDGRNIKIWDSSTGECLQVLDSGSDHHVSRVAFEPLKGLRLASGLSNGEVQVWDLRSSSCLRVMTGHEDYIEILEFDPADGSKLISVSRDGVIHAWNSDTGECLQAFEGIQGLEIIPFVGIFAVSFIPSSDRILSVDSAGNMCTWDLANPSRIDEFRLSQYTGYWFQSIFIVPGQLLVTGEAGSPGMIVKVWDVKNMICTHNFSISTSDGFITTIPGNIHRVAVMHTTHIDIFDLDNGDQLRTLPISSGILHASFSPNGQRLSTSTEDSVTVWDLAMNSGLSSTQSMTTAMEKLCITASGHRLLTRFKNNEIGVLDTATGKTLPRIADSQIEAPWRSVISHCGKYIALTPLNRRHVVEVRDSQTLTRICSFCLDGFSLRAMKYSLDGLRLGLLWIRQGTENSTDDEPRTLVVWDTSAGIVLRRWDLKVYDDKFELSSDGSQVAVARCSWLDVYSVSADQPVATISYEGYMHQFLFSPDGSRLAAMIQRHYSSRYYLLTVDTPRHNSTYEHNVNRLRIAGHPSFICLQFSLDSSRVRWNTPTGGQVFNISTRKESPQNYSEEGATLVEFPSSRLEMDSDGAWIVRNGQPVIWVPPKFQQFRPAVAGNIVIFETSDGLYLLKISIHISES